MEYVTTINDAESLLADAIDKFIPDLLKDISNNRCPGAKILKHKIAQCAQMGFIDAHLDKKKQGLGLPSRIQWGIIRQLSRYNPGFALSYLAHSILITQTIITHNQHSENLDIVQMLRTGEALGSCAITEPEAGSDVMSMKTVATPVDNGYVLDGEKTWITNAPFADYALVYAKISNAKSRELGVFILDCHTSGVSVSAPLDKIGMHSSPTGTVYFNNTFIPDHRRIDHSNAKTILFEQLHFERLMLSAGPIGIMDFAFEKTASYTKLRKQFQKPLIQHGQVQATLATMWTAYQSSIALCEKALKIQESSQKIPPHWAAGCYLQAAQASVLLCEQAIQCHGANGYTPETQLGQYWQDAKLYTIGGGTSEIRRSIIALNL